MRLRRQLPFLGALVLALTGAKVCVWLDTPLPWMIGPLFSTAIACMLGVPLQRRSGCAAPWHPRGQCRQSDTV